MGGAGERASPRLECVSVSRVVPAPVVVPVPVFVVVVVVVVVVGGGGCRGDD